MTVWFTAVSLVPSIFIGQNICGVNEWEDE